jgi:hypothetical protein
VAFLRLCALSAMANLRATAAARGPDPTRPAKGREKLAILRAHLCSRSARHPAGEV